MLEALWGSGMFIIIIIANIDWTSLFSMHFAQPSLFWSSKPPYKIDTNIIIDEGTKI